MFYNLPDLPMGKIDFNWFLKKKLLRLNLQTKHCYRILHHNCGIKITLFTYAVKQFEIFKDKPFYGRTCNIVPGVLPVLKRYQIDLYVVKCM